MEARNAAIDAGRDRGLEYGTLAIARAFVP
jgi:hypothetical protein